MSDAIRNYEGITMQPDRPKAAPVVLSRTDFEQYLAQPTARGQGVLVVVLGVGLVSGIFDGFGTREQTLIYGSIASSIGLGVFSRQLLREAGGGPQRSWSNLARSLSAWCPVVMAYYLTFYDGLWKSISVLWHFSFPSLPLHILSIYLGYRLISWMEILSDVPGHLASGDLIVAQE
mgnify:CR=1 FL=1